ncbi:hypothetical protein [Bradyrhizobium cenepequi]
MQLVPIGTLETFAFLDSEAAEGAAMETRAEGARMAVDPNVPCHAASDIGAAAETSNARIPAEASDMGAGAEPAKMGSAAKPSHMAATATCFGCGRKQA